MTKVNEDLQKERLKCDFNVEELTNFLDGGVQATEIRRESERYILSIKEIRDEIPEEYLSHKERYENAVRKAVLMMKLLIQKKGTVGTLEESRALYKDRISMAVFKDNSPFFMHHGMFIPAIMGQADEKQIEKWLKRATNLEILGTYAQTELGHGTFIRGLETTATYDPEREEFILHSPTLTSYKWWPGNLANTTNYCVVMAQMYSKGKHCGIQPFLVQVRDEETHMPLPGIKLGEIGAKLGFNTANNGFLAFDNLRIPRDRMLMKNAQILKDGTFKVSSNPKLAYGTMVFVRMILVNSASTFLARAATIAVRYSAIRRQSKPNPNEPEPQILDYLTQQHKLFIALATSHAFRAIADWIWTKYVKVNADLDAGNHEELPELHSLTCCLKAVSTLDGQNIVERCRLACGGHGYMLSSNLPQIYGLMTATYTYEGEFTVLMLQTARKLAACVAALQRYRKSGLSSEDAWNMTTVQLIAATEAHCRAIILSKYNSEVDRTTAPLSEPVRRVLLHLVELYSVYWALERVGDLLMYTSISETEIQQLQAQYEELLQKIRPNAVGLVDAFDFRDEMLNSTLGAYDGRVYERLMDEALKSPLNAEPVNQSFHRHLKPFMQGKL